MVDYSLLAPGAVLALWTTIMLGWLAAVRLPQLNKLGINPAPGGRGQDLEAKLPGKANWPSHNYTHLHEQPTVFYAVIVFLTLAGGVTQLTIGLAWAYTALRIVHSIYQSTINKVPVRFAIFLAASACLITLAVLAVIATLG